MGGWGGGGGWWVVHCGEAVFGMSEIRPCICVKKTSFLKASVASKLKPAETNEYVVFLILPTLLVGHVWWAWLPRAQVSTHAYKRTKQLYSGEFLSLSRCHKCFSSVCIFSTLLDVLTIVDHVKADSECLTRPSARPGARYLG